MNNRTLLAALFVFVATGLLFAASPATAQPQTTDGPINYTIEPTSAEAPNGDVQTYSINVVNPNQGIATYSEVIVNVTNTSVANITSVTETRTSGNGEALILDNNNSLLTRRALGADTYGPAPEITIATFNVTATGSAGQSTGLEYDLTNGRLITRNESNVIYNPVQPPGPNAGGDDANLAPRAVSNATFTVADTGPAPQANFDVSNLQPQSVTVTNGTSITVSATVTNTGGASGQQSVELLVDGQALASQQVNLNSGANTTVEFSGVDTGALGPGSYTHEIASANDSATGSLTVQRQASVTLNDQTVAAGSSTVTVNSTDLPDGGFIVIHDDNLTQGAGAVESVIGNSAFLSSGVSTDVTITIDRELQNETLIAMAHRDTDGDQTYDFVSSGGSTDGPYTDGQGAPITDPGTITVEPAPQPTLDFNDQDLGQDGAVTVSNVSTEGISSAILVTYPDGNNLRVAGVAPPQTVSDGNVEVAIDDAGGFPGEHTAHIVPASGVSSNYQPGDVVSSETAANITDQETAVITQASQPDPANFDVTIDSTNSPVTEGDDLTVTATIENIGGQQGTQTVELDAQALGTDSTSVQLAAGANTQETFTVGTSSGDAGSYTATVSSENDSADQNVTVDPDQQPDPANFQVAIDSTNSPVTAGDDLTVTATIENTGDQQGDQTVTLDAGSAGTDSAQVTLGGGESTTVSLVVSTSDNDTGTINASVGSADDSVTQGVTVRDPVGQNVLIQGEITDKSLRNIDTQTTERLEVSVTEEGGQIIFQDVPFDEFDQLEQTDPLVDTANFIPGEPDQYVLELATFGADNQYRIEVEDPQNQFSTFTGDTATLAPRQTDEQNIQLARLINADRLTVLEPGERDRLEDAIDSGNVPFTPAPESRDTERAEFDATVNVDTLVETQDSTQFGTSVGELAPITDDTVDVDIEDVDNPNDGGVTVNIDPSASEDVNSEGFANFDVSLTPSAAPEDYTSPVDVELEFTADSDSSVSDTLTITFVPEVRGNAEISGDVNEIRDDIQLGTSSADQPTISSADTQVHAVRLDTLREENTATITVDDDDERYRVVEFDDGTSNPQDVRLDYLTTTENVEIAQNRTTGGFDVESLAGGPDEVGIHFLQEGDYQIQEYNDITDQFENVSWDGQPSLPADALFTAEENLTHSAVADRFEDDPVVPATTTTEDGEFSLLNLPTSSNGTEYAVIAGGPGTISADGTADGYANFRGFDIIETFPNSQLGSDAEQFDVSLSVQEFEIDVFFNYNLDVTVGDAMAKEDRIPVGENTEVTVTVEAVNQETGETVDPNSAAVQGQEIDLELLDPATQVRESPVIQPGTAQFGELVETTVTVDDVVSGTAVARTTFEADGLETGVANVSASTENDRGQLFETSDTAGVGTNDESNQSQIEVFDVVEITGDVVNEEDNNIRGATVLLFDLDDVTNPTELQRGDDDVIAATNSGDDGSYVYTEVETGIRYGIRAIALDSNGDRVSNTRELNNGNPVFTALGGEDIVVTGASPDQPLRDAEFDASNLSPASATIQQGDGLTVSADIMNSGEIAATQEVTLSVEDESGAVTEIASKQVRDLEDGESRTVTFDVENVQLAAGNYAHTVASEDSSVSGDLTVEQGDDDSNLSDFVEQYDANDDGSITSTELGEAASDYASNSITSTQLGEVASAYAQS